MPIRMFKMTRRFWILFIGITIVFVIFKLAYLPKFFDEEYYGRTFDQKLQENYIFPEKTTSLPENYRPKILIWAKQYHSIDWSLTDLPNGLGGCNVTWDRNEYPDSDAVVFFMKSCSSKDLPSPKSRSKHQAFVWWSQESPWTVFNFYRHKLTEYDNYFNWTMTYRSDADVMGHFSPTPSLDYLLYRLGRFDEMADRHLSKHPPMSEDQFQSELHRLLLKKSRFSSWVVSDCSFTQGAVKRMELMNEIRSKSGLEIDEYGKCSGNEIPSNFTILFQTLSVYKFYFAFENSYHCKDYFTEKLYYNGFVAGTVPIVFGPRKDDVTKVVPPGSFIHYEDFEDVFALAKYLRYLDSDDVAYGKYFDWWKTPGAHLMPRYGFNYGSNPTASGEPTDKRTWNLAIQDDSQEAERLGFYHLCRKLKRMDHIKSTKIIPDLNKLWYGPEPAECVDVRTTMDKLVSLMWEK